MKIAIVSKAGASGGGASRVATELASLLAEDGQQVTHYLVHHKNSPGAGVRRIYGENRLLRKGIYLGHLALQKLGTPELLPLELLSPVTHELLGADLIHVHDITEALSPLTLSWLAARKPLVWTLHDCSPFTGGCINPHGCEKFREPAGCHECPQFGSWPFTGMVDGSRILHRIKRHVAKTASFTGVAPSQWMAGMAESTGFFSRPIVLSNGIDLGIFKTVEKAEVRRDLGLPTDRPVVALCAGDLRDVRKGLHHALSALRAVKFLNPFILAIGGATPELARELEGFDTRFTGYLSDRKELARNYNAADALLYCSIGDNQPLTVMESMACGTPVIGFATGGVPELVSSGGDGYLVPTGDHNALSAVFPSLLKDAAELRNWSMRAATKARDCFGHELFLKAHLSLYRKILND